MHVILVQPPSEKCVKSLLTHVEEDSEDIGFKPPLGILYIATYLKEKMKDRVNVSVLDCIAEQLNIEKSVKKIVDLNPHVVGISAWTDFWYPACELGRKIKELMPNVRIVYGGPHVAIYPHETLLQNHTDAIILGDGEEPFYKYVASFLNTEAIDKKSGIYLKEDLNNEKKYPFYIEKDLDRLPIPDRELLDVKKYSSILFKNSYSSTMITSRGCPFKCTFCKLNFQKTLSRSAKSVVDEFEYLEKLGIKEVEVYDDTFTWSKQRVIDICNGILEKNIKISWAVRDRVSSYDPDLIALMKKAGCYRIHYGIESGVQKVIDRMKKKITIEQATVAVNGAKKAGMEVLVYFMMGGVDETLEDMEQTIKYSLTLPADYAEFSVTIPYAGTEMYDEAIKMGIITNDYWKEYATNPTPNFVVPEIIETAIGKDDILALTMKAQRKFYFRPKYIIREILKTKSLKAFTSKAKIAIKMLLD
ncbi:MAG: B12-binding domain-containing radical SAM protein [Campylobacterales bacterium]